MYYSAASSMDYADVHTKKCDDYIIGAYGGFGGGLLFTSANSFEAFEAIPKVFNINTPIASVIIGYGPNKYGPRNYYFSVSRGPGLVASVSKYSNTNTKFLLKW